MRVLLDPHVVLATLRRALLADYPKLAAWLSNPDTQGFVSVASLWEIAIKTRLGKLDPGLPLSELEGYLSAASRSRPRSSRSRRRATLSTVCYSPFARSKICDF